MSAPLDEDWNLLLSLFPFGWQEQAVLSGALERLRGFHSAGDLLRVLLLHVGKGYSLRETAVRARQAQVADVSDVALLKRLRNAEQWWRSMCVGLLRESGFHMGCDSRGWNVRVVDGTLIKEPGAGGGQWRIHYSLQLPDLECDQFVLTPVKGRGNGEGMQQFVASHGDLVLADRGYCRISGIQQLNQQGAAVVVRWNTSRPLFDSNGNPFPLLDHVEQIKHPGQPQEWNVYLHWKGESIAGRLCVLRKSAEASQRETHKILRKSQQGGPHPKPETLVYAAYIIVFTTLPAGQFSTDEVLRWYRLRWQVELVFKRMKSLAELGHLPKHDEHSCRAWLYGKLLIALLGQKLMRVGRDISPWGYGDEQFPSAQPLA